MKKLYNRFLFAAAVLFGLPSASVLGQVSLNDFGTYTQNFNSLPAATTQSNFVNNITVPGVYAQAKLTGNITYPSGTDLLPYAGNDGLQHLEAGYYSFGTAGSNERALGGIATTFISNGYPLTGTGYVAMRFVNRTGRPIANLEVSYAMEQWYNSGKQDNARVDFDYQVQATTFAGAMEAGTWTSVANLGVQAPSTSMLIASKNGNAPANRRVASATLTGINLPNGKEVVLRWKYVLSATTNGNGLSIDDVAVTPQAGALATVDNIFYYNGSGSVDIKTNWASQPNGQNPTSFTAPNQVFYITSATEQVALPGNFISGTNSKLVIGGGSTAVSVAITTKAETLRSTINVADKGTLEIKGNSGLLPTLATLSPGSTVYYNTTRNDVVISCATFGNLKLNGVNATLARDVSVNGNLILNGNSRLNLGTYDLTVLKGGNATSDGTGYVRTNAVGALQQTVPATATPVFFPVGQGTYNPAWLSQLTTATEDVFGVSVSDSVFTAYAPIAPTTGPAGPGRDSKGVSAPIKNPVNGVNHTWYVSEAELDGSNVTMTLQSTLPTTLDPTKVMVGHYHKNTWDLDTQQKGKATTINTTTKEYKFTRTGITGFSPFTLSAGTPAPLPVELLAFEAKRVGNSVACTWATATEMNNNYFQIERSLDGQSFQALARVAGAGSTTTRHDYRWVDAQPATALAYYRLRQVDFDGTATFSPLATVAGSSPQATLTASPNPTAGPLALTFSSPVATTIRGTVTNALGLNVLHFAHSVAAGTQVLPLDLSALPASMYLVHIQTPQGPKTLRLVKQ